MAGRAPARTADRGDVDELHPARRFPGEQREQIAHAAGGNPLFITEMLAMAAEAEGEVAVPPTLQALLAARLDQLEARSAPCSSAAPSRGRSSTAAPSRRSRPRSARDARLAALVRKELIRPDKPQLPGEDAFRFRHLLIRDAAYDALPKATRAELHERFADWLGSTGTTWSSWTRSSAITSSRRLCTKRNSAQPDATLAARAGERLAGAGRRALCASRR